MSGKVSAVLQSNYPGYDAVGKTVNAIRQILSVSVFLYIIQKQLCEFVYVDCLEVVKLP